MTGEHAKLLSVLMKLGHQDHGTCVLYLSTMEEAEGGRAEVVGAPRVTANREISTRMVRQVLFETPPSLKDNPDAVVWSSYDEEEGKSVVGVGLWRPSSGEDDPQERGRGEGGGGEAAPAPPGH